jgi:hypothetical protein
MCIPRKLMPQIDQADMEELLKYLDQEWCITGSLVHLPLGVLRMEQCLHDTRAATNPLLRDKPLLVSADYNVVDGNGRYLMYQKEGHQDVCVYYFNQPFAHVTLACLAFPKAYRYADGPQPYRI